MKTSTLPFSSATPSPGPRARRITLRETTAAAALEQAKRALGQEGLTVLDVIDLRDMLARRTDHDIGPFWLVEFFHPQLASRELSVDAAAGLSVRHELAVWQDGKDAVVASLRASPAAETAPGNIALHVANAMGRLAM